MVMIFKNPVMSFHCLKLSMTSHSTSSWKCVSDIWDRKSHSWYYTQHWFFSVLLSKLVYLDFCLSWAWDTFLGGSFSIPENRSLMYNFNRPYKYYKSASTQVESPTRKDEMRHGLLCSAIAHCLESGGEKKVCISVQQTKLSFSH